MIGQRCPAYQWRLACSNPYRYLIPAERARAPAGPSRATVARRFVQSMIVLVAVGAFASIGAVGTAAAVTASTVRGSTWLESASVAVTWLDGREDVATGPAAASAASAASVMVDACYAAEMADAEAMNASAVAAGGLDTVLLVATEPTDTTADAAQRLVMTTGVLTQVVAWMAVTDVERVASETALVETVVDEALACLAFGSGIAIHDEAVLVEIVVGNDTLDAAAVAAAVAVAVEVAVAVAVEVGHKNMRCLEVREMNSVHPSINCSHIRSWICLARLEWSQRAAQPWSWTTRAYHPSSAYVA